MQQLQQPDDDNESEEIILMEDETNNGIPREEGDQAASVHSTDATRHSRGAGLLSPQNNSSKAINGDSTVKNKNEDPSRPGIQPTTVVGAVADPMQKSSRIGRIFRWSEEGDLRPARSAHGVEPHPDDEDDLEGRGDQREGSEVVPASWHDVYVACCFHSATEWLHIGVRLTALLFFLYFFLLGLELMGTSFKVVGGCTAGSLLGSDTNPLSSLIIGIIATALLQSSSTTASIIVSLVSGGLDVHQAIYMIMGANVGTSVTSMLVSLAHMGDGEELERAFSGCATLWAFNFFTLIVLFPLEIGTEYLYRLTKAMLPETRDESNGSSWEGPVKKLVSPLGNRFIIANKDLIDSISTGEVDGCSSAYPVECDEGVEESYTSCFQQGLIACDEKTGKCPVFFQNGASQNDDMTSGWVMLFISLFLLCSCLIGLVAILRSMLLGASTRIIYKATNINPLLAMVVGCGVTVLVQSSSITTSALVPLAGVGVLKLEAMLPLVLGADIGTTITAFLAASVSDKVEALQIALVHMFFNVTGVVMWYPLPWTRNVILRTCRFLGRTTRAWRNFPVLFIVLMYFVVPLLLLGISTCFEKGSTGFTGLGVFLVLLVGGGILYFAYWWRWKDGQGRCRSCIARRQRRAAVMKHLADDMDYLKVDVEYAKNEIGRLKDFAGLATIEEARPAVPHVPVHEPEPTMSAADEDQISLYESCLAAPWVDVVASAAGSVRGSFHSLGGGFTHPQPHQSGGSVVGSVSATVPEEKSPELN